MRVRLSSTSLPGEYGETQGGALPPDPGHARQQ
jgi:hypothetical protein